ncbi:Erp family protein (plasmid) [Borreliella bissettiae DN127]|uniref:Erp family protein n=1 Tax=Borrelia bissettiae (strain DSM 17990 / CIP 109136 / DN127) TaxID=521010 RepID=G0ANC7_BORBD|nr:Erp family protein [Borreliella bissettiae]AEL19203.1 Erp family protein [Borreliella bissettiae DN127]
MNKIMKIFTIWFVFAMIISCKNFAADKDIKQNAEGKIKGFLDKILDPVKDKIASNGPKVDELVKKLQEEEKELMQGDDPDNGVINPPPVLPASDHDNTPVPAVKVAEQNGGQQKEQAKESEAKVEEEKVEDKKEKQDSEKGKVEEKKEEQNKEEQKKKQEEAKAKEAKEKEAKEKQKRQQAESERRAREEKQRQEQEEVERKAEEEREREEAERKAKDKIKDLVDKIAKINGDIDDIKGEKSVGATKVKNKVTGPVYDDFVDGENSIRKTWGNGDLEEDEEDSELGKVLKELSDSRDKLRNKLNVGNQAYDGYTEPPLKENVNVNDIKDDLEKVKSGLEKVKSYLEDNSKFEEIKGYIEESNDDYE